MLILTQHCCDLSKYIYFSFQLKTMFKCAVPLKVKLKNWNQMSVRHVLSKNGYMSPCSGLARSFLGNYM